jgi:hypothetical protein
MGTDRGENQASVPFPWFLEIKTEKKKMEIYQYYY